MSFLDGYKTYITAAIMLIIAVAGFFGIQIPGFNTDPGTLISSALGLIFVRQAVTKSTP